MRSGICGNQMCWQLSGEWKVGCGTLDWGLFHFGHQGCPFPTPLKFCGASVFSVSTHPCSAML